LRVEIEDTWVRLLVCCLNDGGDITAERTGIGGEAEGFGAEKLGVFGLVVGSWGRGGVRGTSTS